MSAQWTADEVSRQQVGALIREELAQTPRDWAKVDVLLDLLERMTFGPRETAIIREHIERYGW